jgi:TorA maturation chaperone TorD
VKKSLSWIVVGAATCALAAGAAVAAPREAVSTSPLASAPAPADPQRSDRIESTVRRAFREVLKREPSERELRRYTARMEEDDWTESDIRRDLRERSDYRAPSRSSGDVDRIIRRAYQDILDREPDTEGMRGYRRAMIDDGWTEQQLRDELRKSPEYSRQQEKSAERVVRRVYREVLNREPDPQGLANFRNQILNHGWDESDVRDAIKKSPERRELTRAQAEDIVTRAYRAVLKRDADKAGMQGFVDRVIRDRWTQADVEQELRKSDEYRNLKK